jgi:L-rhamnose mutarotase
MLFVQFPNSQFHNSPIPMPPLYGPTNPSPENAETAKVKRCGSVNRLRPEFEARYRELHANAWPTILNRLHQSHIQNYSIYLYEIDGIKLLFSYFEYTGDDFAADMQAIADDPETQRWWTLTDPCQNPLPEVLPNGNWADMEMIFQMD